jgi:UDP-2,3-diacylglucosamine hydrolase
MMVPVALFISDLHLQPSQPKTCAAFFDFLERHAMAAKALYVLGDLFEYWVGDDDLASPFNAQISAALKRVSAAGVDLYWIAGNRDFLVGPGFAAATGTTLLTEPFVANIGGQRIALLHGDAQCTDDVGYMEFRAQVRQPAWQQQFLALPLAQRHAIVAGLRKDSQALQSAKSTEIMDVAPLAISHVFDSTATTVMIHGHTHRPALHAQGRTRRHVLPDWDLDCSPARGGWIAAHADGSLHRVDLNGVELD